MWLRFILRTVVGVILRDVTRPVMQHAINRTMKANHKRREIRRKRELAEFRELERILGPDFKLFAPGISPEPGEMESTELEQGQDTRNGTSLHRRSRRNGETG